MATQTKGKIKAVGTLHGGPVPVFEFPEASSQSFAEGDLVYLVNGLVTICGDDPAVVLGVAQKAASGTANTMIPVALADPMTIFEGNVNKDDDAGSDCDGAQTDVGLSHGMVLLSGTFYVDLDTGTTNNIAVVIGPARSLVPSFADSDATSGAGYNPDGLITDVYARVKFVFESSAYQLDGGATSL